MMWEYVQLSADDAETIVQLLHEAIEKSDFSENMTSFEEIKEMITVFDDARTADGTATTNGHIATRALCAQFGTAQQRILGEVPHT